MRDVAETHGIEVLAPDDVNAESARKQLAAVRPDLFVVCDYGQILSAATLEVAPLGGINLHGSLLPRYRGAAPVQWALLNGESETGVSVIHMTPKLDAGPVLSQQKTPIEPHETAAELEPRLAQLGVESVSKALTLLERWDRAAPIGTAQDRSLASRAPRLRKEDGRVDWTRSNVQLYNQFRALQPWPGIFTEWHKGGAQPIRLILESVTTVNEPTSAAAAPGSVVSVDERGLSVATGSGQLIIHRLQPAGKRSMPVEEFLRGHPMQPGARLG